MYIKYQETHTSCRYTVGISMVDSRNKQCIHCAACTMHIIHWTNIYNKSELSYKHTIITHAGLLL